MVNLMYYTQTDIANRKIEIGSIESSSEALKQLIFDDSNSEYKQAMSDGQKYFLVKNTEILENKQLNTYATYENTGTQAEPTWTTTEKTNPQSANIKKPSAEYRISVKQKIEYGLANGTMISYGDKENANDIQTLEDILSVLGKYKDVVISEFVQSGSNAALGYIYVYIDTNGKFQYTVMDPKEIIVVYKDHTRRLIDTVYRYYHIDTVTDGKTESKLRVEIYTETEMNVYNETKDGFIADYELSTAFGYIKVGDETEQPINWGRPPFIEYVNNPERITDLQAAKLKIDDLDYQDSKLSNDYTDKPDHLINIRGYSGDNPLDLADFFKTIGITFSDEDGGVDSVDMKIPYEGKHSIMKETKKDIFTALQAVDTSAETVSKAPSGVALTMMYKPLEMKVQSMYQGLTKSLYDLMYFVNKYFKIAGSLTEVKYETKSFDIALVEFAFTPNRVINLVELADVIVKLSALLPKEELLKLLPFVDQNNIKEILEKIEAETEDLFNEPIEDQPTEDEEIVDTAEALDLNSVQIKSAIAIVNEVGDGLTANQAKVQLKTFFGLTDEQANNLIDAK